MEANGKQPPQFVLTKTTDKTSNTQAFLTPEQMQQRLNDFNKYTDYTDVQFYPKTGGLMATHLHRKKHKNETTPLGLTPTELEDACQMTIFQMGEACIIQNEKTRRLNGEFASALDAEINGELMDIRSVCTEHTKIVNSLTDKHKQLISFNKDTNKNANALCLYYHVPEWYDEEALKESITSYKKICNARKEETAIKKLVVVLNGYHSPIEIRI